MKDYSSCAHELFDKSIIILAHDHVAGIPRFGEKAEDLLRFNNAGVTAKSLMNQTDALILEEASEGDVFEKSLTFLEGFRERAESNMASVREIIQKYPEKLMLALSSDDIVSAKKNGKCAIVFGFEGGKPLEGNLDVLDYFYQLGLRHLQLNWACSNQICDWAGGPTKGLTECGREVILKANELGIMVDLSHSTDRTYYQALEICAKPIICGHVSVKSGKRFPGDMDDARLKALAQNGGVLGIHFWSHYLNPDAVATVEDIIDHMNYVVDLTGIDHIALGPDYANVPRSHLDPKRHHGNPVYVGPIPDLDCPEKLPLLAERMLARGFKEQETQKVLGENYLRVFKEAVG